MTITSEQSKVIYQGNGSTREFTIPFSYANESDLEVQLQNAGANPQVLTLGNDYALIATSGSSGGSCVLSAAPAAGSILAIRRDPPLLQETVYEEGVPLSAKSRENALDLLTMIAQSNRERIDRALLVPVSWEGDAPVVQAPVPGAVLAWDTEGNLCNGPNVGLIQSAAASASEAVSASASAMSARDAALAAQAAAEEARDEAVSITDGEHNTLSARDAEDCHPQSAITGLGDALSGKADAAHGHTLAQIADAGSAAGYTVGTDPDQIPTNADISAGMLVREFITTTQDWTVPDGVTELWVWVMGGGGGGGTGRTSGGCGGGGGGCAYRHLTVSPGAVITCTIGVGGYGATSSGPGWTGGTSSFGAYCSATGGTGGKWAVGQGTGGIGIGGDVNYGGSDGGTPGVENLWSGGGAAGGPFGGGGVGQRIISAGNTGGAFGGGGGGGCNNVAAYVNGGDGGVGGIVIEYYA